MKSVSVADLRHRVTLEQAVLTSDGAGGSTITWSPLKTIWAKIKPITGRETFERHKSETAMTHKITLRYDGTPAPGMRLTKETRCFRILSVIDLDEKNRWLQLDVREEGL